MNWEGGTVGKLKNKIKVGNVKDWEEEVYVQSTLKCIGCQNMLQGWRAM